MEKKSIIYIVLTAFFFGTLEVASKLGGASFNAIQLVFLRFLIGGVMLLPFAIHDLKKRAYKLTKSDLLYLLGLHQYGNAAIWRETDQCQSGIYHNQYEPIIYNDLRPVSRWRAIYEKEGTGAGNQLHRSAGSPESGDPVYRQY